MNFPTIDRSFFAGECFDAYRVLGAHPCRDDFGQEGWRFAVWAPGAVAVEICGGFDGWGPGVPMQKHFRQDRYGRGQSAGDADADRRGG